MLKLLTSKIKKGLEKCIDAVLPVFAKMDGKTGKKARSLSLKRERAHLEEEIAGQLISLGRGLYEKLSKDKERSMAKQLEVEESITNIEANVNVLVKLDHRIDQKFEKMVLIEENESSKNP